MQHCAHAVFVVSAAQASSPVGAVVPVSGSVVIDVSAALLSCVVPPSLAVPPSGVVLSTVVVVEEHAPAKPARATIDESPKKSALRFMGKTLCICPVGRQAEQIAAASIETIETIETVEARGGAQRRAQIGNGSTQGRALATT